LAYITLYDHALIRANAFKPFEHDKRTHTHTSGKDKNTQNYAKMPFY